MENNNRLANEESNEDEDSFDAFVPMSRSEETEKEEEEEEEENELDLEEEDFNPITIEKVPMNILKLRIGRIISEIMLRGEPAAVSLFDVASKIVFQSTMLKNERNTVLETILNGLTRVILDVRELDERAEQAEYILMRLVTKLAVKNKALKCDDLLFQLIPLVERLYLHVDSFVRFRIVRLISMIVEEANKYSEAMQEHGDDVFWFTEDEPPDLETVVPEAVKTKWMGRLATSLLDKSPQVRSAALAALSLWDPDTTYKARDGDELTVNQLLWKSVHDVDESVRLTAAQRVHITNGSDIDKCMDYVECSTENRVRQIIVVRLASDVHLFSFSDQQRFRFVNLLSNSDSARVQDVIHQRLVESWMSVAAQEIVSPSIFPAPDLKDEITGQFPTIIIQFLDPMVDQHAAHVFMKFAIVHFIRGTTSSNTEHLDVEQFLKDLLDMSTSESECLGLMRRTSFRLVDKKAEEEKDALKKTFLRVFISRAFLDVVFQLSRGRLDGYNIRNRAVLFFIPDVTRFCDHLEQFCLEYMKIDFELERECVEALLVNILHLLNVAVKHGDNSLDRELYQKSLKKLMESANLHFSTDITVIFVTTILDLCKNDEDREKTCEWMCETAEMLLLTREDGVTLEDLQESMKEGLVLDRMYFRSATILLAMCQHEEILKPSVEMSELFKALIPALLGNKDEKIQAVGLQLIGFAASIDFENCGPYLKLTRFLIQRDNVLLKGTGMHTLIRVIKRHGFPKTAKAVFEGENIEADENDWRNSLAKLIEKTLTSLEGSALVQAVQDCLSMLSHGNYAWPKLISALLLIVFQKLNESMNLGKILKAYFKSSIRSIWSKVHLLQGFTLAISIVSRMSEHESSWNVVEMTAVVCEQLSRVQTIGEAEEAEEGIHVEVELANRMIRRALMHPSSWVIRHVFTSLATSLSLECIPLEQLDTLNDNLVDAYTKIRFKSGKTTQIAIKRFLTQCEKVITLQKRLKGLKMPVDLKKVKDEEDAEAPTVCKKKSRPALSSTSLTEEWDDAGLISDERVDPEDSFEYFPKSTRTRKRPNPFARTSMQPKRPREEEEEKEEEEAILDYSFEL